MVCYGKFRHSEFAYDRRDQNFHVSGSTPVTRDGCRELWSQGYVNESLAPGRGKLQSVARQAKKDKSYTYPWIRGGKILMRKLVGDAVRVLKSMDDIAKL